MKIPVIGQNPRLAGPPYIQTPFSWSWKRRSSNSTKGLAPSMPRSSGFPTFGLLKSKRLDEEALSSDTPLTPQERWNLATDMPEGREHNRLCRLQDPFYLRMDALVKQMSATPGHTAEGRLAKWTCSLGCI